MISATKHILKEALRLPATERAGIADKLLSSLDNPDSAIDSIWKREVDHRIVAYRAGKIRTVSVEEALSKYRRK
jgi:putative addiction module component (TIGR02574 family)